MGVKRPRICNQKTIVDVWQREVGLLSSRNFAHRLVASQDVILKFDILRKLEKHRGCVNTVSFNEFGDILVSGSDDKRVILWDWETGRVKLSFHSGHGNNVFQAKFMPYSDNHNIVTCAADGQVRHAQILEGGRVETWLLGRHQGRAHKLAIEPGSGHIFYTCGEDGLVQHFDLRTQASTKLFTCHTIPERRSLLPTVRLNAIAIDPKDPNMFAVGGSDEYARVYDIRWYRSDGSINFDRPIDYYCPDHLIGNVDVGITGIAFSYHSELLVSYNNEHIYLFSKNMGWGRNSIPSTSLTACTGADEPECNDSSATSGSVMELDKKSGPQVYEGHENFDTVKGVSFFGPKCDYVVSGSDCGRIFIWRRTDGQLIRVMEADKHVVNCIESHPHTAVLASSGIERDIKIWTPNADKRATLPANLHQIYEDDIPPFNDDYHDYEDDDSEDDDDYYYDFDDEYELSEEANDENENVIESESDTDSNDDEDDTSDDNLSSMSS